MEKFSLKNKTAFITGGAGLIGSEVTKALADAGAHVVILDVDKEKGARLAEEIKTSGDKADYEYFDITQVEEIDRNIEKLVEKYNNAHVWVNTAYPRTEDWKDSLETLKVDAWQKNVDAHLGGYFFCSRKIAEYMKKQKAGSIINFASIYGIVGPNFSVYEGTSMTVPAAYSAIKGGIINFTRYLAAYLGKYNVRVNCVSPGGVYDNQPAEFTQKYNAKTPLGRMADKGDASGAVVYLASDASAYVTGHNLVVDGGWTAV